MSSQQDPFVGPVFATVARVMENYVVTYPERDCGDLTVDDSVTFSLPDWRGADEPQAGQVVELFGTALYSRGWRAKSASPVVAEPETLNQRRA